MVQLIVEPFDLTAIECDSSSISSGDSSTLTDDDPFPLPVIFSTPRQLRRPVYYYPIRDREGIDFVFGFNSRINTSQADAYFHADLRFSAHNLDFRLSSAFTATGPRNVKLGILSGKYKKQSAVVLKSYVRRSCIHKVLLGDGSVIFIHQRHVRLLDPFFFLPFGFPTYRH